MGNDDIFGVRAGFSGRALGIGREGRRAEGARERGEMWGEWGEG